MDLTDVEQKILAEGDRIVALARKGALEVRRLNLKAVLEDIEAELKKLEAQTSPPKAKAKASPKADEAKAAAKE